MKRFDAKDAPEIIAWVKKGMERARKDAALSAAHRLVGVIQGEIIPGITPQPVFEGAYRAGWHAEATEHGADVVNSVPYAPVIEWGARAQNIKIGAAMIKALTEWVRRKGLTGADGRPLSPWAIAKSMQRRGIFNRDGQKGLRVAEKAAKRAGKIYEEEFVAELRKLK